MTSYEQLTWRLKRGSEICNLSRLNCGSQAGPLLYNSTTVDDTIKSWLVIGRRLCILNDELEITVGQDRFAGPVCSSKAFRNHDVPWNFLRFLKHHLWNDVHLLLLHWNFEFLLWNPCNSYAHFKRWLLAPFKFGDGLKRYTESHMLKLLPRRRCPVFIARTWTASRRVDVVPCRVECFVGLEKRKIQTRGFCLPTSFGGDFPLQFQEYELN